MSYESAGYDFAAMREAMVESQLRTTNVDDQRLIRAMGSIAREDFVPAERRALAYAETLVPLGEGRRMNLPLSTARLLDELALKPDDAVLVIGAATGYPAALCSRLAGSVVALESDPALAGRARELLGDRGNVEIVEGEMEAGWVAGAPYDAILIDGAVDHLPEELADQLAEGGRLAAAIDSDGVIRLVYGRKHGGGFGLTDFAEAQSARLPGFEHPRAFVF
ncbi:MAG: protein-L-isoaspartate O-methyltransferase [Sphingomonadales bacterium]|nr:protein-L-isoaspartate O-methyltransferase [Sphingomonadales bacterium]